MKYLQYAKYLIKHKYYVLIECFKRGIYWQGIKHDLSKFYPSEFIPYAPYFYGRYLKGDIKEYKPADLNGDIGYAWFLHQKRNKHHWHYWILPQGQGKMKALDMPMKYRKEMLCDWIGASKAQGNDLKVWYRKYKDKIQLHPETRKWVEAKIKSNLSTVKAL